MRESYFPTIGVRSRSVPTCRIKRQVGSHLYFLAGAASGAGGPMSTSAFQAPSDCFFHPTTPLLCWVTSFLPTRNVKVSLAIWLAMSPPAATSILLVVQVTEKSGSL